MGYGRCKLHGGASPAGRKAALWQEVEAETERMRVAVMGTAIDVDPMDALLWCVRITAGEVAYSSQKVADLEEAQVVVRPTTTLDREGGRITQEVTTGPEELNLWIKVRQQAVANLAKFSKMALDAGVAVRQVALAEQAGEGLASAFRSLLDGLNLTAEQEEKAPGLVRDALVMLEGRSVVGEQLLNTSSTP